MALRKNIRDMARNTKMWTPSRRAFLATSTALTHGGCFETAADQSNLGAQQKSAETPASTLTACPTSTEEPTRWHVSLDGAPTSPASGPFAYVGAGTTVYAFDHCSGDEVWSRSIPQQVTNLVSAGDRLYVRARGQETDPGGAQMATHPDMIVIALDATTGEKRWDFEFDGYGGIFTHGSHNVYLKIFDDAINDDEYLVALDRSDGTQRWMRTLREPLDASTRENTLYVGGGDGINALDTSTGEEQWQYTMDYQWQTLVVGERTVAAVDMSSPQNQIVRALNRDGNQRWTFDEWNVTGMTIRDESLYVNGERIGAFNVETGDQRWSHERDEVSPTLYRSLVVSEAVISGGDGVRAYAVDNGTQQWSFDPAREFVYPAAVHNQTAYIHTAETNADGQRHVYGVNATNGEQTWHLESETGLTHLGVGRHGVYVAGNDGTLYALS